jgi:hypothetical protein
VIFPAIVNVASISESYSIAIYDRVLLIVTVELCLPVVGFTLFGFTVSSTVEAANAIWLPLNLSNIILSLVTTILSTLIIVIQILRVSRLPGVSRQPYTAIGIIIESAALYSVASLVYIPISTVNSNGLLMAVLYAEMFYKQAAVST